MNTPSQTIKSLIFLTLCCLLASVGFSGYIALDRAQDQERELLARGKLMGQQLSLLSEFALYADNKTQLQDSADTLLQQANVSSVLILDAKSQLMAMAGHTPEKISTSKETPLTPASIAELLSYVNQDKTLFDQGDSILLYQPVWTPKTVQDEHDFDPPPSAHPLGAIIIELSRSHLHQHNVQALWQLALLITAITALAIFLLLKKTISKQLHQQLEKLQEKSNKYSKLKQRVEKSRASTRIALTNTLKALDKHAVVVATDVTGRIISANDLFCQISGYTQEELLGQNHRIIKSGMHTKDFFKQMYHTIARGNTWTGEVCNRAKDGSLYWMLTTISAFLGEDGKPAGYISVRTDITERKKNEQDLERYRTELEEMVSVKTHDLQQALLQADAANRAKSTFLANMSHEIRTPMNGVIGMLDVLQETSLTEHQQRMLKTISDSAFGLLGILNDILDYSKIEAGKLTIEHTATPLREIAESVTHLLCSTAQTRHITLTAFISPDLPREILSDPMRLRQILFNILSNALKFTCGKASNLGKVSLRIEPGVSIPGEPVILIRITDNGIGMSAEVVSQLFKPFKQADESTARRFGGTGLGLSICQKLVELMGGQIRVSSTPGAGSEFTVELPLQDSSNSKKPERKLRGISVLIAELSPQNAELVTAYCQAEGADILYVDRLTSPLPAQTVIITEHENARLPATLGVIKLVAYNHYAKRMTLATTPLIYNDLISLIAKVARLTPQPSAMLVESPAAKKHSTQRILLAEDNEINREVMQEQLHLLGYPCDTACDGAEAFALWQNGTYALLLTDCHMPNMDGFELTNAIRGEEKDTHLTIIAVTANAMMGEAERCCELGMNDYLSKPVRLEVLEEKLNKWLS